MTQIKETESEKCLCDVKYIYQRLKLFIKVIIY